MTPLSTVLVVRQHAGSYGPAGACAALFAAASAIGAPLRGRLMDRYGQTPVLVLCGLAFSAGLAGVGVGASLGASTVAIAACAGVAGIALPPLGAAMLSVWRKAVDDGPMLQAAYAFDVVCEEAAFLLGMLLVALLISVGSPLWSVLVASGLGAVGPLLFSGSRRSRQWRATRLATSRPWAMSSPGVRTVIAQATAMGVGLGTMNVGLVAFARARGSAGSAGLLLATWSLGSIVGGLWFARRRHDEPNLMVERYLRIVVAWVIFSVPICLVGSLGAMFPAAFAVGFFLAPTLASLYLLLGRLAPDGAITEALSWVTTAAWGGNAIGAASCGVVVDLSGVHVALAGVPVAAAVGAVIAVARRGSIGSDAIRQETSRASLTVHL
jgi:MFS family permease